MGTYATALPAERIKDQHRPCPIVKNPERITRPGELSRAGELARSLAGSTKPHSQPPIRVEHSDLSILSLEDIDAT
jgi:hypothetical protein